MQRRDAEMQRLEQECSHGEQRSVSSIAELRSLGPSPATSPHLLPAKLGLPLSPQVQPAARSCHCCCFLSCLPCCGEESVGGHPCPQAANMMAVPEYPGAKDRVGYSSLELSQVPPLNMLPNHMFTLTLSNKISERKTVHFLG